MDKSLIYKAKEIANQQEITRNLVKERHIKKIYDEVMRILEDCIKNEKIYNGYITICTDNSRRRSYTNPIEHGYHDWDYNNIVVGISEGPKVAEMIRNNEGINCEYHHECFDDSYFLFNFNN